MLKQQLPPPPPHNKSPPAFECVRAVRGRDGPSPGSNDPAGPHAPWSYGRTEEGGAIVCLLCCSFCTIYHFTADPFIQSNLLWYFVYIHILLMRKLSVNMMTLLSARLGVQQVGGHRFFWTHKLSFRNEESFWTSNTAVIWLDANPGSTEAGSVIMCWLKDFDWPDYGHNPHNQTHNHTPKPLLS